MKKIEGIWLPDNDQHFVTMLSHSPRYLNAGTYQLKKYKAALAHCTEGRRVAVDVGGHVGLWSRVMAGDFEAVHAFEPLPMHIECFERNTLGMGNVTLNQFALGDAYGTIRVKAPFDNTGHAHVHPDGEEVQLRPLDAFEFPGIIDLLKIDVEGFELEVVRGAEFTIRDHRPTIIVEQKPNNAELHGAKQHDATKLLESWGMRCTSIISGDHIMVW